MKTVFSKPALPEPWSPAEATNRINQMASDDAFTISYKGHATKRMAERNITMPDVVAAMKKGFVHKTPVNAKQPGLYKYAIEGQTPNSNGRNIRVIVIPSMHAHEAKIVTVMWADEQ